MSNRPKNLVLPIVAWMTLSSISASVEAGPLLDWLFRRNRTPVTTAYYGAQPAAGCCGAAYCEQTVVRYVPQVAYRTVWQPVPVTTYRRTTHCNPQTGLPMTCTRPCTTYTYQARRVPYTTYRPVYSKVAVTSPSTNVGYQPYGCNSCSIGSSAGYSTPSYSTPYYADDSTYSSDPAGASPWETIREGGEAVQDDYDSDPSDPGNRPPRIQKSSMNRRHRLSRVASTSPRSSRPDPFFGGPTKTRQLAKSEPTRAQTGYRGAVRSSNDRQEYESGSQRHSTINRNEISRERNRLDLQPIPNIESPLNKRLPELIDRSNNREATLIRPIPTRWASKKIDWDHIALASHVVKSDSRSSSATGDISARKPYVRGPREKRIQRLDDRYDAPRTKRKVDRGWSKLE